MLKTKMVGVLAAILLLPVLYSGCAQAASSSLSSTPVTSLTITTTALANGDIGTFYSQALGAANGSGAYTWSMFGSLPKGLALDASSGVISGTPTTGSANFTINVSDGKDTATRQFSLTINPALVITTTSLPDGQTGSYYSQQVSHTGGDRVATWSVTGTLPPGLYINEGGMIGGTAMREGTFNFQLNVSDGIGTTTRDMSITITSETR
jgi:hypothetical protein